MSEVRSHYPMPDDAETIGCEIWADIREGIDEDEQDRRKEVKKMLFEVAFGTEEDFKEGRPFPFHELSEDAVASMSPLVRADYDNALAASKDPRSGGKYRPRRNS